MTSPAIMRPHTEGMKAMEEGVERLVLSSSVNRGVRGFSVE